MSVHARLFFQSSILDDLRMNERSYNRLGQFEVDIRTVVMSQAKQLLLKRKNAHGTHSKNGVLHAGFLEILRILVR